MTEADAEEAIRSDEWLDDLAGADDSVGAKELAPSPGIDDSIIDDQPLEDQEMPGLEIEEHEDDEQQPVEVDSEVPGWLGRLVNKLLDTFDNDFVNEWFARDKDGDGEPIVKAADGANVIKTAAATKAAVEIVSDIDPTYGEEIPDWLRQSDDMEDIDQSDDSFDTVLADPLKAPAVEPAEIESEEEEGIIRQDRDKYGAVVAAGAVASSDEWLLLLDRQGEDEDIESETEAAEALPVEKIEEPQAQTIPVSKAVEDELIEVRRGEDEQVIEDLAAPIGVVATEEYLTAAIEADESSEGFTITGEQRLQVALLRKLTSAEPRAFRPVGGQVKTTIAPNLRLIIGLLLILLILIGWLIPTSIDPLDGLIQPALTGSESDVFEAIQSAAGKPVLVAFEYTPAMAGELDVVASPLLNQMADNGSPVIAVSQIAAGTVMAEKMLESVEDIESFNLGFLPGEAIGLRRLALCLSGEGACDTIFGEPLNEEAVEALNDFALILVLASDRDSIINWIEQVEPSVEQEMIAGIIQPLEPIVAPYVNSEQLVGTVPGAQSALAYQELLLNDESGIGIKASALTLAFWFALVVLIAGSIFYALSSNSPPSIKEPTPK